MNQRAIAAEFIGTFAFVAAVCGTAMFSAPAGGGPMAIAFAAGLSVLAMAFAIGHISGCHLNPAVTLGLCTAGRFPKGEVLPYWIAQVAGACVAAGVLFLIASGKPGFELGGFAANGYGDLSPGKYSMLAALVCEIVMTFVFLMVILGATDGRAPAGFAPIAIGLCLTLIHLISIPVTNTSVNPARSTSQALFAGADYSMQLWLFWLAPLIGAALAGLAYPALFDEKR